MPRRMFARTGGNIFTASGGNEKPSGNGFFDLACAREASALCISRLVLIPSSLECLSTTNVARQGAGVSAVTRRAPSSCLSDSQTAGFELHLLLRRRARTAVSGRELNERPRKFVGIDPTCIALLYLVRRANEDYGGRHKRSMDAFYAVFYENPLSPFVTYYTLRLRAAGEAVEPRSFPRNSFVTSFWLAFIRLLST